MTKKFTDDFRKEVVNMYLNGIPAIEIAKQKKIRRSNVYDWITKFKENSLKPHGNKKIFSGFESSLIKSLEENPFLSMKELLSLEIKENLNKPSKTKLHSILKNLGFSYSKEKKQWIK